MAKCLSLKAALQQRRGGPRGASQRSSHSRLHPARPEHRRGARGGGTQGTDIHPAAPLEQSRNCSIAKALHRSSWFANWDSAKEREGTSVRCRCTTGRFLCKGWFGVFSAWTAGLSSGHCILRLGKWEGDSWPHIHARSWKQDRVESSQMSQEVQTEVRFWA